MRNNYSVLQSLIPLRLVPWRWVASVALILSLNGCSLFFGNIKPVEEKSKTYGIVDLSRENSEWVKVDPKATGVEADAEEPESGVSDTVFQSKKTASIISINSACKGSKPGKKQTLQELSRELLLGISDLKRKEERQINVSGVDALETTVQGKINQEEMVLRTVVLIRANCVYDLMYVSRPERFAGNENDFNLFVSSLRLK